MFLFAGLGNFGSEYEKTRHNAGFNFIDNLTERYSIFNFSKKFSSYFSNLEVEGELIHLIKPLTYMNLSGDAILSWKSFYKEKNDKIFIFYDDVDIDLGRVKIMKGGSSAGHNGIKSITSKIGEDYFRVRIGIKTKDYTESKHPLKSFVLQNFSNDEHLTLKQSIRLLVDNIDLLISEDKDSHSKLLSIVNS